MLCSKQLAYLLGLCVLLATVIARPDGGETHPLPGPGLSYGGIPYGSMSGNIAEFFRRQGPSNGRSGNVAGLSSLDYAPIEQWL